MKLVSIIIPVYNAAPFLEATIRSALRQTYPNKEIIIVDDGSSDGSFELAQQFEAENVIVIQQANAGAAVARNTGLSIARGGYIQFLDAGDLLDQSKIEAQVAALAGSQTKLAVCNYVKFSEEKELQKIIPPNQNDFIYSTNDTVDFLINLWGGYGKANFIQTNCWLVSKDLIKNAGPWRNYRCPDDDGEFFARIILASDGIIYVPGVYNYYRIAPGANQLSRNTNQEYIKNKLLTIDLKYNYLKAKNHHHPALNKAIAMQYFHFAVYHFPRHKEFSNEAYKKYKSFNIKVPLPLLGGFFIQTIAHMFGWRFARLLRAYLRER